MHVRPGPFFPNNFLEYSGLPSKQTCALISPGIFFILWFFKSFPQSYWIFETWCNGKILNWFITIGQVFIDCALIGPCAFIWDTMVPFYSPLTLFCTQIWQYGVILHTSAKVIYFKNYRNSNESCTFVFCDLAFLSISAVLLKCFLRVFSKYFMGKNLNCSFCAHTKIHPHKSEKTTNFAFWSLLFWVQITLTS